MHFLGLTKITRHWWCQATRTFCLLVQSPKFKAQSVGRAMRPLKAPGQPLLPLPSFWRQPAVPGNARLAAASPSALSQGFLASVCVWPSHGSRAQPHQVWRPESQVFTDPVSQSLVLSVLPSTYLAGGSQLNPQ